MKQLIIDNVNDSIEEVCSEYLLHPSYFFTENDLVCRFYQAFSERMGNISVEDSTGKKHNILHTEYPTPFRCDMHGLTFEKKCDQDSVHNNPKNKYKRGHYDVVILNPMFIKQYSLEEIRAQNYEIFKKNVLPKIYQENPLIIYGLEFHLKRGKMTKVGTESFIKEIWQDHNKLVESVAPMKTGCGCNGILNQYKTLAFFEDTNHKVDLEQNFQNIKEVKLCCPN
jgi:hypothetical protein